MDASRFDALSRVLSRTPSRRAAVRSLGGLAVGITLGRLGLTDADAKKKGGKKGRKRKKDGGQNGTDPPPPPPGSPAATCGDGLKNGSETDVDCGGACSRCANGQSCLSRNDCAGALCLFETCRECFGGGDCGFDGNGACFCAVPEPVGPPVCNTNLQTGPSVGDCGSCPPGTTCFSYSGQLHCHKRCGA